jgi:hypothetical protein
VSELWSAAPEPAIENELREFWAEHRAHAVPARDLRVDQSGSASKRLHVPIVEFRFLPNFCEVFSGIRDLQVVISSFPSNC